jgi:hypothetical protein
MRHLIHFTGHNQFGHKIKDSIEIEAGTRKGAIASAASILRVQFKIVVDLIG